MTVGERIKELRLFKKNMKKDEFAKAVGRKPLAIDSWEKDRALPSLPSVDRMLKVFNMTYEEFMRGVEL